jgi:hypothetical protein
LGWDGHRTAAPANDSEIWFLNLNVTYLAYANKVLKFLNNFNSLKQSSYRPVLNQPISATGDSNLYYFHLVKLIGKFHL